MTYLALFVFPVVAALAGLLSLKSLVKFVITINRDLRGAKPNDHR
jgi:hypothetical protein